MSAGIPTLSGSLVVRSAESIITYTLARFTRTPKGAIPMLDEHIISLPWLIAQFGAYPDSLCSNIQTTLQACFDRIFAGDRKIGVSVSFTSDQTDSYEVTISISYTKKNGDPAQLAMGIPLKNGRLVIPENTLFREWAL